MNYQKIYNQLVENAKSRTDVLGYTEKHHIIPRALGGSDDYFNIVVFTAREHFIAHLLLAKIYGGPMWHAAHMMSNMAKYSNRKYAIVREEHSKQISVSLSGRTVSHITRKKISENKERSANISKSLKGRPKSDDHKEAYRQSRLAGDNWAVSDDHKKKISDSMRGSGNPMWGKTHSEESRKIISEANKQQTTCPHCGTTGGISIMKRWHYDNCKQAPNTKVRKKYLKRVCPHCGKEGGGSQMSTNHFDNCKNISIK